jgi:hypothetical protein
MRLTAPPNALTIQTNMTTAYQIKKLTYKVSHDWMPYRFWVVQAESEIEARMSVAAKLGCELNELEAKLK